MNTSTQISVSEYMYDENEWGILIQCVVVFWTFANIDRHAHKWQGLDQLLGGMSGGLLRNHAPETYGDSIQSFWGGNDRARLA